jgi:large subunit ribosomal protein L17
MKGIDSMRHNTAGKKIGRTTSHRYAMLRNMVTSFLRSEKIMTTDVKAKMLQQVAEKMITLGKRGDLHARRQASAYVRDRDIVGKLFTDLSDRFRERSGGYTRIVKMGYRVGDSAPTSVIELIGQEKEKQTKSKKKDTKQKTKT